MRLIASRCSVVVLLTILTALSAWAVSTTQAQFWISVQFFPGGGGVDIDTPPHPWQLTIANSGETMQQTNRYKEGKEQWIDKIQSKSFLLSRQDLNDLINVINQQKFFDLPSEISDTDGLEHYASIRMRIVLAGRTHETSFAAPNKRENGDALKRFWAIWIAITKKIPSPNKDEELLFWMRREHPDLLGKP